MQQLAVLLLQLEGGAGPLLFLHVQALPGALQEGRGQAGVGCLQLGGGDVLGQLEHVRQGRQGGLQKKVGLIFVNILIL